MVDDIQSPWLHGDSVFDYVHARSMQYSIKSMPFVLSEAYRYALVALATPEYNIS